MLYCAENETEASPIRKAILALADGSVYEGVGFGASAKIGGEVVFNTGIVGYPESITDPSYHGQILCQTYPLIGNYGVNPASFESDRPRIAGYIVSELCEKPSHATSTKTLNDWLRESGVPGIAGLDTRALTKKLRVHGVMPGLLAVADVPLSARSLRAEARNLPDPNARDLVAEVTTPEIRIYNLRARKSVVLIDCGAKQGIIRSLSRRGVSVVRVPADTDVARILSFSPRGVVVSNGPGDPKRAPATIATVRKLMREGLPVFGICLGNQILALAAGADTYKLKFGHRSQNQPCLEEGTKRCYITSQNHGFAVDRKTLPRDWAPWFTNANDGSNEGVRHRRRPFWSVQFHPEACPGPTDTEFLFDEFLEAAG
ncbi:MAG: glutamine-hydrolyzing carbamoyl-phosphate synthase small subunit [Candidatus Aminicenantales bacterium]